ncbi:MAG: hypothetical protein F6K41_34785 [Symploca sp. SIO3E6]|nr:hypothetical protein [Caldora sp. SIO3E6]
MSDNERLSQNSPVAYINWTKVSIDDEQEFVEYCSEVALKLEKKSGFICLKINKEITEEYEVTEEHEINWFIYTEWKSSDDLNSALSSQTFNYLLRNWEFKNNEPQYKLIKDSYKRNLFFKFIQSPAFLLIKKFLLKKVTLELLLVIAWLLGIMLAMAILFLR